VEDMDMLEVEGVNMVKEHDDPLNHQLGDEGIDTTCIHMLEVEGMYMVEKQTLNH
jgi:hypothetical protein